MCSEENDLVFELFDLAQTESETSARKDNFLALKL